jgi:polar amino acid transport system ATP-binding protein
MSAATPMIVARDVTKVFGRFKALNAISMEIAHGSVQCIIGPSGSGKSTFLRCINRPWGHVGRWRIDWLPPQGR